MTQAEVEPESRLSEQLGRLLRSIESGGWASLPRSDEALLQSIVDAAARIFGAAAASIALVNEREGTLVFRVAYGAGNQEIIGMSIPLDKGIAGYVAMTGQPIATSNVQRDARFNKDFAQSTGYVPRSILATPLMSGDRVIGVMEVLDKIDAPSFGLQDMELLGMFANQAAIAIHQSQQFDQIGEALVQGLKRLAAADLAADSAELVSALEKSRGGGRQTENLLALADLFNDISGLGESERRACLQILQTFAAYARSRLRVSR
jgi:GAF domain-containing protein